jgi:hypothetical protein
MLRGLGKAYGKHRFIPKVKMNFTDYQTKSRRTAKYPLIGQDVI